MLRLIRDRKLFPALGPSGSDYFLSVGSGHSLSEAVLVLSFSLGRLKCSFHRFMYLLLFIF